MNRTKLVAVVLSAILIGTAGVLYWIQYRKVDYVIPGVMPLTMYNSLNELTTINQSGVAELVSLLRYWGEPIDMGNTAEIDEIRVLFDPVAGPKIDAMRAYFDRRGYTFQGEILRTPKDLKKYINAEVKTPLFFNITFSLDSPTFVDYRLLIGVNEKSRTLVFHHYTLGSNYEMTFEDFEKLWMTHPYSRFRHRYFSIQPKNITERLVTLPQNPPPYPPRSPLPEFLMPILADFNLAMRSSADPLIRISHFAKVASSQQFLYFHPVQQVRILAFFAGVQIQAGLLEEAFANLKRAEELNHDLNRSYEHWVLFRASKISLPFGVFREYYRAKGDSAISERYDRLYAEAQRKMLEELRGQ